MFYTDAQFWHSQLDPEERNTDDWDMDTSVYYGGSDPDKDSRDMRDMNLPQSDRLQSVFTKRKKKDVSATDSFKRHQNTAQSSSSVGTRNLHKNFMKETGSKTTPAPPVQKQGQFKKPKGPTTQTTRFSGNSFSRKMMAQQGWKAGQGLGAKASGIKDPVDTRGQMTRAGLGYKESEENPSAWNAKPTSSHHS